MEILETVYSSILTSASLKDGIYFIEGLTNWLEVKGVWKYFEQR